MIYHKPPAVSKSQVNRAGELLKSLKPEDGGYSEALYTPHSKPALISAML